MFARLFFPVVLLVGLVSIPNSACGMPLWPDFGENDSNWIEADWDTWPTTPGESIDPSYFKSKPAISKPALTPRKTPNMYPDFPDIIGFIRDTNGEPGSLRIESKNFQNANPYKQIWLEIKWEDLTSTTSDDWVVFSGADSYNPPIKVVAQDNKLERIDSRWKKGTWYFCLSPNPVEEYIDIRFTVPNKPDITTWKVDSIRLRTQCTTVPEPSTLLLLLGTSLVGLAVYRRSRGA